MKRTIAIVIGLAALYPCIGSAQKGRSVVNLPICPARPNPPSPSWPIVDLDGSRVTFQVPPNLAKSDNVSGCIHGCEEWAGNGVFVLVSYGYWGEGSFDADRWTAACQVRRNGLTVVLMPSSDDRSVLVWPVRDRAGRADGMIRDFVIRVDSQVSSARQIAEEVARSVRVK